MLHLPEKPHTGRSQPRQRRLKENTAEQSSLADRGSQQRLRDLESPIADAKLMASILATILCRFGGEFHALGGYEGLTAKRMVSDLSDDVEQILFAAYEVEKILRNLERQYHAPTALTESQGEG